MPGGLMQLVNKGAQDQLITGSPSFTHFRSVYKRHTEFAMEHFVLNFRGTSLDLHSQFTKSFRVKVDRNAQLLHDCYVHLNLPDIYSPVSPTTPGKAVGYEFQWVPSLGYNMIKSVSVLINGTAIVTHTGEWMKLYSYLTHDANKREIIDRMIGNVPEMVDPANAYGKMNQYPHSITTTTKDAAPSILGRELVIPLHFWFCEDIGSALPLVSLQYSEVEFVIEFNNIYSMFTVNDVRPTSPTFNTRIAPVLSDAAFSMNHFLSVPNIDGSPENVSLVNWKLNPFVDANYIFLSDSEVVHLAKSDNSFMIKELRMVKKDGVHGPSNDIELTMMNLCTRIVWIGQRSDIENQNGVDNYTNWINPNIRPIDSTSMSNVTPWYSSGNASGANILDRNILVDATLILDGAEREQTKTTNFYNLSQNYKHHTGICPPGIYTYSFASDHHTKQPSGHINGSMFNKTILRVSTLEPPSASSIQSTQQCVLKSSALDKRPVVVLDRSGINPDQTITIISKPETQTMAYTYSVRAYVESYNFLRITRGIANVVFSS